MTTDLLDSSAIADAIALVASAAEGAPAGAIDAVDLLVMLDRAMNRLAGYRAEVTEIARKSSLVESADPHDRHIASKAFTAEIACALRLSERGAENLIGVGRVLAEHLPATFGALTAGEISWRHVEVMVDNAGAFEGDILAEFEQRALARARELSATRFKDVARRLRERMRPDSILEAHRTAVAERQVTLEPDADGMAWISAKLEAPTAQAIFDRLTKGALALAKGAKDRGDDRTLAQRRADLFARLMLAQNESSVGSATPVDDRGDDTEGFVTWFRGIRPEVIVTVPVLTLLGAGDEPAELDGYGPIDPETASILAGRAKSFIRLLTHPETGAVLSVGRKRYKVPKDLRTWLRVRDGTCRFPGCGVPAARSEIDHNHEWQHGGATDANNLADFCKGHHMVKSSFLWTVTQARDGSGILTWRSPTGHRYTTKPAVALRAIPRG